jgi:hypothetical protein
LFSAVLLQPARQGSRAALSWACWEGPEF